jgi:hypothetical protein
MATLLRPPSPRGGTEVSFSILTTKGGISILASRGPRKRDSGGRTKRWVNSLSVDVDLGSRTSIPRLHGSFHRLKDDGGGVNKLEVKRISISAEKYRSRSSTPRCPGVRKRCRTECHVAIV